MSTRLALYVNVGIVAALAAGVVVGLTLDTRTTPHQPSPLAGKPPVPTGLPAPYGPVIEAAFRNWPHGSIDALQTLGLRYPGTGCAARAKQTAPKPCSSAVVQYYRGVALLWAGYPSDATAAFESAKKYGTNTMIHNQADAILHPNFLQTQAPFYPVFNPIGHDALLLEGSKLQEQGHQKSAEKLYARAARLHPGDDQAQVAAAVGLFDEDNVVLSFSHLGPLTQRFPKSQSVRYYLGLLLGWTGMGSKSVTQFEKVVELGPKTALGKAATRFLKSLAAARSSTTAS